MGAAEKRGRERQRGLAVCARLSLILGVALGGCFAGEPGVIPEPDFAQFQAEVYPQLVRDCAFNSCHGDAGRYFPVYGPGRRRLSPDTLLFGAVTPDEIQATYDAARAMLISEGDLEAAPLLAKPREGSGHAGVDAHGRNVYTGPEDARYQVLVDWAQGGM